MNLELLMKKADLEEAINTVENSYQSKLKEIKQQAWNKIVDEFMMYFERVRFEVTLTANGASAKYKTQEITIARSFRAADNGIQIGGAMTVDGKTFPVRAILKNNWVCPIAPPKDQALSDLYRLEKDFLYKSAVSEGGVAFAIDITLTSNDDSLSSNSGSDFQQILDMFFR
ncbi:hypothetical protein [Polluticoccus soli]|uniref:hypothetical protein n=1 Tax=Polluticoccus soli TaxID=3034150 RepID=UPI0023E2F003|nr:hypothetical protein [Flavipsychrobacter sp. JY13-12]